MAPSADRVLTAVLRDQGVEWLLQDAGGGPPQPLGRAAADAALWVVDDGRGDFYFAAGAAVWRDSWRDAATAAVRVADLPPVSGVAHAAWIDADSGELRLLEMRPATAGEAAGMKAEPPDARPFWALLWRLHDGTWSTLQKRATSWGSDGAVGPAVFDDLRRERGRSARAAEDSASCPRLCDETAPAPIGVDANAAEEWRKLPGSSGNVVFGVSLGDTWHITGPVVALGSDGTPRLLVAASPQALRLDLRQGLLLVAPSQLPAATAVFDLASGAKRVLEPSAVAPVRVP